MVKCWNCDHLMKIPSGEPSKGMLFAEKFYRCRLKDIDFKMYYLLHKDRECEEYVEGRYWLKNRQFIKSQDRDSELVSTR